MIQKYHLSGAYEGRQTLNECPSMMLAILVVKDKLTDDLKESLEQYIKGDELSVMTVETARQHLNGIEGVEPPFIAVVSPSTGKILTKIKFKPEGS
jgi:hypothetical protein